MKYYFLYLILRIFLRNPILALVLVILFYVIIDRRYIGILPDFFKPFNRQKKINVLKNEIEINPYQGHAFYELGALSVEKGNFRQSIAYLEKARELMPDYPDIYYNLGVAYINTGLLEEGKDALERALQLNPKIKYGAPYIYLTEYMLKAQTYNDTVREYIQKIKNSGSPEYCYKMGEAFRRAGYIDIAKEMYAEAVLNYRTSAGFYRKVNRYWAFRARIRGFI